MNTNDEFSARDAASLIVLARRAPLTDMQHAEAVQGMLNRFAKWYEMQTAEPDTKIRSIE